MSPHEFSAAIVRWYQAHGRKTLPWQQDINPYKVWVSEIMLQQTQVSTVIGYYQRFIQRFADIHELAQAPLDEVLHLWTGLGYYSRARNLHKTAQLICRDYAGNFPSSVDALNELPGIGRSTAGAIASLSMQVRAPILDGNVKRVLARYSAEFEHPNTSAASKRLWQLAEQLTPAQDFAHYNQAMMDIGATLCTRSRPQCDSCPVREGCSALKQNLQQSLPVPRPKKQLPKKTSNMLIISDPQQQVMLYQRPPQGLWGGLFSLPELDDLAQLDAFMYKHQLKSLDQQPLPPLTHKFSHFELTIEPWLIQLAEQPICLAESGWFWYNTKLPQAIGLAAPIKKLLRQQFKLVN